MSIVGVEGAVEERFGGPGRVARAREVWRL